jgi:hypothetical protein
MNRDTIKHLSPVQLAVAAITFSLLCSLGAYMVTRRLRLHASIPDQPAIDRPVSETAPPHFTEDMVIPGFTETGEQIEQDDDTTGRSPGGV